jgi:hypothetical protein
MCDPPGAGNDRLASQPTRTLRPVLDRRPWPAWPIRDRSTCRAARVSTAGKATALPGCLGGEWRAVWCAEQRAYRRCAGRLRPRPVSTTPCRSSLTSVSSVSDPVTADRSLPVGPLAMTRIPLLSAVDQRSEPARCDDQWSRRRRWGEGVVTRRKARTWNQGIVNGRSWSMTSGTCWRSVRSTVAHTSGEAAEPRSLIAVRNWVAIRSRSAGSGWPQAGGSHREVAGAQR